MNYDSDNLIHETNPTNAATGFYTSNDDSIDVDYNHHQAQSNANENPKSFPQYLAALAATLSALSAGAVLGWTSPILDQLEHGQFRGITINTIQMGWIGSFVTLGGMTMCIPTGFICDLIGRKLTLLSLILPFSIGWILIFFANNIVFIYFGRLLTGMASGACCVAAPLYINEIAHKDIRGSLGTYFQLMVTVGIFLAYVLGAFLNEYIFTILCSCFPLLFIVIFVFQPESPVYLLKKGLYDDAKQSLIRLRGTAYDVDRELQEMECCLRETTNISVSFSQTLKQTHVRKALIISFTLMFCQQFSGVNAIVFYSSDIFKMAKINLDPNTGSVIVGGFQALSTFVASLTIERLGRRMLLLISTSIIAISNFLLALYFTLKYRANLDESTLDEIGFLPVLALCVFIIVYSLGIGPIPWLISGELFAPEIKSVCSSAAGTFNWFLAFLITKFYKEIAKNVGEDSVFYSFCVLSFFGMVFIYFMVPETKGKTISEVQDELAN